MRGSNDAFGTVRSQSGASSAVGFTSELSIHHKQAILAVGIDDKILLEAYPKEFYHLCQS